MAGSSRCSRSAGRRLVEQQDARPAGQRQRDLQLTLLAVGEVAHHRRRPVGEPHRRQRLPRALLQRVVRRQRAQHRELDRRQSLDGEQAVLEHGEGREEVGDLERPGQPQRGAPVRRHPGDVALEEADGARRHRQLARDEIEERRLAGAIGPDERAPLARAHGQRDAVDGAEPAERLRDRIEPQGQLTHRQPSRGLRARASRGSSAGFAGAILSWGEVSEGGRSPPPRINNTCTAGSRACRAASSETPRGCISRTG